MVAAGVSAAMRGGAPPPFGLVHDRGHVLALVAVRRANHGRVDGSAVALAVEVVQDHVLRPRQRLLLLGGGNVEQRQLQVRRHRRGVLRKVLRHLAWVVVAAQQPPQNTVSLQPPS